jgi:hypothetical protein
MFLLYYSDRNTSETVFHWCYVNDLHTTHVVVCWVTTWTRKFSWRLCSASESMMTTSYASQIARDYMGSHRFRNAWPPYGALHMDHHVIRMRTIYTWLSRHVLKPWAGFAWPWWLCLERTICELELNKTLLEDFPGCLGVSIACTWLGRTPICLQGVYKSHTEDCSVIFEAVTDQDL